jgi:hypothetical protein
MEPVLFVMAILGCGEGDAPCREVAMVEARYRSEAACQTATATELARQDILYPTVVAQCRRADARAQAIRASDVALPDGGVIPDQAPRYAARSSR